MLKNCDASVMQPEPYLWLRNNVFYYRIELPRVDGKRRYKRISLHTSSYYEAREKVQNMNQLEKDFNELRILFNDLIFEANTGSSGSMNIETVFSKPKKLSKRNKTDDVERLYSLFTKLSQEQAEAHQAEQRALLNEVRMLRGVIEDYIGPIHAFIAKSSVASVKPPAPAQTISEVLESMLSLANNCKEEQVRKRNLITKMVTEAGLNLSDDYSKFHDVKTIETISKNIVNSDMKGDGKKKRIWCIKELATYASNREPDHYRLNVIANLPNIDKTRKSERQPHLPYSEAQLLELFDPKHDYFKKNPDIFFSCMIALFTGARANSAVTLQYENIIQKDGIDCIHFIKNHKIKRFKNEASERTVPIHPQLLDLGFVDYVRRNQEKLKTSGKDFIFPKCKTSGDNYNNKYTVRGVIEFATKIGVKTGANDGLDFHSFRKNASIIMQDAGIIASYINDIIGFVGT